MGLPVVFTPKAQEDLADIVRFIARDSSDRARSFGNVLIDQATSIGDFPNIGRVVPELGDPSVRELIHGAYRIVYEVFDDPQALYILRFWHAARGIPEIKS